jgi:hypothetical protein
VDERLINAAPKLLAALREWVQECKRFGQWHADGCPCPACKAAALVSELEGVPDAE